MNFCSTGDLRLGNIMWSEGLQSLKIFDFENTAEVRSIVATPTTTVVRHLIGMLLA